MHNDKVGHFVFNSPRIYYTPNGVKSDFELDGLYGQSLVVALVAGQPQGIARTVPESQTYPMQSITPRIIVV